MEMDHVGIAVTDLSRAIERWQRLLGTSATPPEDVPSNGVRVAFLASGGVRIELLEPLGADSTIARFLEKRGEGMHHVAFRVPDVDRALAELAARGERVIDRVGRPGSRGHRVGFAHPAAFGGVLVEFVEAP